MIDSLSESLKMVMSSPKSGSSLRLSRYFFLSPFLFYLSFSMFCFLFSLAFRSFLRYRSILLSSKRSEAFWFACAIFSLFSIDAAADSKAPWLNWSSLEDSNVS